MRIWFDTEFIEDGHSIDLISFGAIREDGQTLYLENEACDLSRASPWVQQNVIPHLTGVKVGRSTMRRAIVEFAGKAPEFWAFYASYDWVALCQLFGSMMDLPDSWPMHVMDVQQECKRRDMLLPEQKGVEHHALADAIWLRNSHLKMEAQ